MERIYLDHAATTPLLPSAREAMRPWLESEFGNPSSLHDEGRRARAAIDESRETIAGALACEFGEVVFTSSGTEAANLAIVGAALSNQSPGRRKVLFGAIEHHCVLHTAPILQRLEYEVVEVPADRDGAIRLDLLASLLDDSVLLVALMHANNELGTRQPAAEASRLVRDRGALFFCDAVQTFGFERLTVDALGADLLAISAHKLHGPKGVGALYVRAGVMAQPLTVGGGQERELRAGTENVAGIVGFAAAARALAADPGATDRKRAARDAFASRLRDLQPDGLRFTVEDSGRVLPGHCHLRIEGLGAEIVLINLDRMGIAASSGAACSSGSIDPSHVMKACGYSESEAREGLRFTFGMANTPEEAVRAAETLAEVAASMRAAHVR